MKIILISFFDSYNLGDLLISKNIFDSLKGHTVIPFDFPTAKRVGKISTSVNREQPHAIKKACALKRFCAEIYCWLALTLKKEIWQSYRNALKDSDMVIIGGGNLIMDTGYAPCYTYLLYRYIKIAGQYGKKARVLSVGVGPFNNFLQSLYARIALNKCEYIGVRDSYSLNQCEKLRIKIKAVRTADAAFALENPECKKEKTHKIGLCLANFLCVSDFCSEKTYFSLSAKLIELLSQSFSNYDIEVFSTEKRDYITIENIFEAYDFSDNVKIKRIYSLSEAIDFYKQQDFVVGMRMHSLIIAMLCHIPCFGIGWQKKVDSLFDISHGTDRCTDFIRLLKAPEAFVKYIFDKTKDMDAITAQQDEFIIECREMYEKQISDILKQ